MGHKVPKKVSFAAPCLPPPWLKKNRARGQKAAGLRFERAVAKAVPGATHGQWFQYLAEDGPGWCQPDLLLVGKKTVVVIEVKLTNYVEAKEQLMELYLPILSAAYPSHSIHSVIILRHVSSLAQGVKIYEKISEALEAREKYPVVHWLGVGPV